MAAGIDQGFGAFGVAAQDFGQWVAGDGHGLTIGIADQVSISVIGQHALGDEVPDRPRARAFTVGEELDQHRRASSRVAT